MKKLFLYVFLGLLWCNVGFADELSVNSLLQDGYKIIKNDMIKKTEVETGIRNKGNLEILSGLNKGDKIISEGLTKVRPGMKVKPIIKSQ